MAEENTQKTDSQTDSQKEDWEKRYKDLQAHSTPLEQELKTLKDDSTKDKELIETLSQFVDWNKQSQSVPGQQEDLETYVTKKDLQEVQKQLKGQAALQDFRTKHPDMVEYESIVSSFITRTDPRRRQEARLEEAVGLTKKFLETERSKGKASQEAEVKEKVKTEAETAGLETTSTQPESEEKDETYDEYIEYRKAQSQKTWSPEPVVAKNVT